MMTEAQFLNRFQRQPNGEWACTKPIKVNGPSGPVMIEEGTSFSPGALFLGLDLAKELDQMAAKHRLPTARRLDHEHRRSRIAAKSRCDLMVALRPAADRSKLGWL